MKLIWVNHFASLPTRGRGVRHFELSRELMGRGWKVKVVAAQKTGSGAAERGFGVGTVENESLDGVEFRWIGAAEYTRNNWRRGLNWLTFTRGFDRWARSERPPDVVIGSSPHLFAALAAKRRADAFGVPFVFEVRDLWPESILAAGGRRGPFYYLLDRIATRLYAQADRILVLAEGTGEYLVGKGIPTERILFVPNGVDATRFPVINRPERDQFTLTYAGAHGPANGLDTVLDAAAILRSHPKIRFRLIGTGPSKDRLVARAHEMELRNVQFDEPVPPDAIPEVLAESDAGLMVLRDDPLFSFGVSPNKLFDYLAAAMPVVCNVPGEVARLLRQSGAGVQTSDTSAEALAASVLELWKRGHASWLQMGASGRQWVERERSRSLLAGRLDRSLRELLAQHRS